MSAGRVELLERAIGKTAVDLVDQLSKTEARVRICEQVRDDLALQVMRLRTQVERLKFALRNNHKCKDPEFHMRTLKEREMSEKAREYLEAFIDAQRKVNS